MRSFSALHASRSAAIFSLLCLSALVSLAPTVAQARTQIPNATPALSSPQNKVQTPASEAISAPIAGPLTGPAPIQPRPLITDLTLKTLRVGNLSRSYFSERSNHEQPLPLIIAFHGLGSTGSVMSKYTRLTEIAESAGFMVVYPIGTGLNIDARSWNSGACCGYARIHNIDDVGFIRALVKKLVDDGQADASRIYAVGFGNGGMMAYRMTVEAPELIKAVAVVSATLDVDPKLVTQARPVLHIHGTEDPYLPFLGGVPDKPMGSSSSKPLLSVPSQMQLWVKANGANPQANVLNIPDNANDGTSVVQFSYRTATDPEAVVLYQVKGGGMAWPGGAPSADIGGKVTANLDASHVIVDFLGKH
jgi:polyhydroxybutyrate depolymerase